MFPPERFIRAISERLGDIHGELEHYLYALEDRIPSDTPGWDRIKHVVFPYEAQELIRVPDGGGTFVVVDAPRVFGSTPEVWSEQFRPQAGGEISVAVYTDTDDEERIEALLGSVDELVATLGYAGPLEEEVERGSVFRRSTAKAEQILESQELQTRLIKIERALELAGFELRQSEVDQNEADAVARILAELRDMPRACIRAGSVLVAKFPTPEGPVVLARTLSQVEIRALEKFPEIQKSPERLLELLVVAVENLDSPVPQLGQLGDTRS